MSPIWKALTKGSPPRVNSIELVWPRCLKDYVRKNISKYADLSTTCPPKNVIQTRMATVEAKVDFLLDLLKQGKPYIELGHVGPLVRYFLDGFRNGHSSPSLKEALVCIESGGVRAADRDRFVQQQVKALAHVARLNDALKSAEAISLNSKVIRDEINKRQDRPGQFRREIESSTPSDGASFERFQQLLTSVHECLYDPKVVKRLPLDKEYASFARGLTERLSSPEAVLRWVDSEHKPKRPQCRALLPY